MFFCRLLLWLSVSGPVFADSHEAAEPPTVSYAVPAALVDLSLIGAGMSLIVRQEQGGNGPLRDQAGLGLGIMVAAPVLGGTFSHGFYGNPDARLKSLGLRAKHLGLGAIYGLGSGLVLGLGTTGVCAVVGGGYCALALGYGVFLGPPIGAIIGVGRGMALDYKTLAIREKPEASAGLHLQPTLSLGPEGSVQLGLAGGF
jgi:hypothetical protein